MSAVKEEVKEKAQDAVSEDKAKPVDEVVEEAKPPVEEAVKKKQKGPLKVVDRETVICCWWISALQIIFLFFTRK